MAVIGLTNTTSWNVFSKVGLEQDTTWDVAEAAEITDCDAVNAPCNVFSRVNVDFMVLGISRVSWELKDSFAAPQPWTFQLQVGNTGNQNADDWVDAGAPVTNANVAEDQERRAFGKQLVTYYRVKLTDDNGTVYYSDPATTLGGLGFRDWLLAREHIRQERLRLKNFAGISGYILKRKRHGTPCTQCLDPYTGDVLNSTCPICKGTRYIGGYYRAVPCQFADMTNSAQDENYENGPSGWTMPTHNQVKATFVATILLETGDVFVDGDSDLRYFVHVDETITRIRGVPLSISATLEQLEFSHVIYTIPLSGS